MSAGSRISARTRPKVKKAMPRLATTSRNGRKRGEFINGSRYSAETLHAARAFPHAINRAHGRGRQQQFNATWGETHAADAHVPIQRHRKEQTPCYLGLLPSSLSP